MRASAIAVAVALAATATACTNRGDRPTAAAGPTGGTLRVAISEPGSLDPGNAYEPAGMLVDSLLCEPLLTIDPETGELKPGLAATWIVSNGGRRITLRLRKARFASGARVTSDDVIASLSRAASEEFAGNAASLLQPVDGWEEISGRRQTERERDRRVLRGLTAIDGSSLAISLSRGDADFVRVLAHPVAAPVPRAAAQRDPDGLAARPDCAGPYQLDGPWAPGQGIIKLVRNPHYHGRNPAHTAGGRGYADTIEFHVRPDAATQFAAWQQGQVDVAPLPAAQRGVVSPEDRDEGPSGFINYVGLPLGDISPFKDARVRVALSTALDRTALSSTRTPALGFIPGAPGCGDRAPAAADPARARALLNEAGADLSHVTLPLAFHDEFDNRTVAEAVARQWHDAFGVTVQPTPTPFEAMAAQAAKPGGLESAFLEGWQPAAPRPDAYVGPLFTSAGIGRDNLARFVDPAFERNLDREARAAANDDDRDLAYRTVEQRLCQAMPLIPLVAGVSRWVTRARAVGGAKLDRARGGPVLREFFVRTGGKP